MNFFMLWLKKLVYYKRKSLLLLVFLIIPLILFSSFILFFLNGYYESFEVYSQHNIGPDISFYSDYDDIQEIYDTIEESLKNQPYFGSMSYSPIDLKLNLTIYNPSAHSSSNFYNQSIEFKGLNFSNNRLKNLYIDNYIPIISGKLPSNDNEIIVPEKYKSVYNLSLNSVLNFHLTSEINQNVTVVGFYLGNENIVRAPKNGFIFLLNDLDNQIFQKFINMSHTSRYHIYLDHKQMDIFNLNSFISQISQIMTIVKKSISNYIPSSEYVFSSSSMYQDNEFNQVIFTIMLDLIAIVAPITLIICIFLTIISTYITNTEKDYWEKSRIFSSPKSIKFQIFFNIFMNNFMAYLISIPLGILLYFFSYQLLNFNTEYEIYLPLSYYYISLIFFIFSSFVIFLLILRKFKKFQLSKKGNQTSKFISLSKKYRKLIIFLIIMAFLPFLSRILYFSLISIYNPLLSSFIMALDWFSSMIMLFYSTFVVLLITILASIIIIKLIQYNVKTQLFSRIKNQKFNLLKKFFMYRRTSTILIILVLGLQLAFLNFYHIKNYNQSNQNEYEIYLDYGSDFKLYDDYNINHTLYLKNYVDDDKFCRIKTIPGVIDNETIFDQNIVILSFNASKYFSVLNEKSNLSINSNIISNIQNLNNNEILVPSYLKIKYNLQIGDILVLKPKNASMMGYYQIVDNYSVYLSIRGFFNNLPGLDNDNNFNDPYSSQGSLLMIANHDYNYSAEFPNLPIKHTYLIKEFNSSFNTLELIVQNHSDTHYISLSDGLKKYSTSHLSISLKHIDVMYAIFVISFILLTLLFVYNYISQNFEFWNLFQLFGLKEKELKRFIFTGLNGILLISFLIGLTGIISGITVFWFDNLLFKSGYYIYPIEIQFDFLGLLYNFIYLGLSLLIIWLLSKKIINYSLNYEKLRKYNPE